MKDDLKTYYYLVVSKLLILSHISLMILDPSTILWLYFSDMADRQILGKLKCPEEHLWYQTRLRNFLNLERKMRLFQISNWWPLSRISTKCSLPWKQKEMIKNRFYKKNYQITYTILTFSTWTVHIFPKSWVAKSGFIWSKFFFTKNAKLLIACNSLNPK